MKPAQALIDLIRAKTSQSWWDFHGADIEKAVESAMVSAVEEAVSELLSPSEIDPCRCNGKFDIVMYGLPGHVPN